MSKILILIIIVVFSLVIFVYFSSRIIPESPLATTESVQEQSPQPAPTEISNVSLGYEDYCKDSIEKYVETIENISNITIVKIDIFDINTTVIDYLEKNWSTVFYNINGMKKDISNNTTVVAIVELTTNEERDFTLPILCDESGKIGNYSSCLLDNIPNLPSACYNLTINLTECEIERREHTISDDVEWNFSAITGATNDTKIINYTVSSARKRLESFGITVFYRSFSSSTEILLTKVTKKSDDGGGGSIVETLNLTDKPIGILTGELLYSLWFKKKCFDIYLMG